MDRSNKALGFALALSFVAVACAAPTIPDSSLGGDSNPTEAVSTKKPSTATNPPKQGTTAPTDPSNPAPSDPNGPAPTDPATPGSCGAKATFAACFDCCDAPTGGALKKADDAFGQCACGGGQCSSACTATFCAGQQPSAACDTCLTNTCDPAADALCTTAACKAGQQCVQTSGCEQKAP